MPVLCGCVVWRVQCHKPMGGQAWCAAPPYTAATVQVHGFYDNHLYLKFEPLEFLANLPQYAAPQKTRRHKGASKLTVPFRIYVALSPAVSVRARFGLRGPHGNV